MLRSSEYLGSNFFEALNQATLMGCVCMPIPKLHAYMDELVPFLSVLCVITIAAHHVSCTTLFVDCDICFLFCIWFTYELWTLWFGDADVSSNQQ